MDCLQCGVGHCEEGEDFCESCLKEWEADELRMQEAEFAAEQAYVAHLELPSANEPIDDYEAAMRGIS